MKPTNRLLIGTVCALASTLLGLWAFVSPPQTVHAQSTTPSVTVSVPSTPVGFPLEVTLDLSPLQVSNTWEVNVLRLSSNHDVLPVEAPDCNGPQMGITHTLLRHHPPARPIIAPPFILRQTSATGVPSSTWHRPKATCSRLYRDLFLGRSSIRFNLDHPTRLAL